MRVRTTAVLCMASFIREQTPIWWVVSGNQSLCACVNTPETTLKPLNRTKQKNAKLRLTVCLFLSFCLLFLPVCVWEGQWGFVHCLTFDKEVSCKSQNRGGIIISGAKDHIPVPQLRCTWFLKGMRDNTHTRFNLYYAQWHSSD